MSINLRNAARGIQSAAYQHPSSRTAGSNNIRSDRANVRVTLLNMVIWVTLYYAGYMTGMYTYFTNENCSRKLSAALEMEDKVVAKIKDPETREMQRIIADTVQKRITRGQSNHTFLLLLLSAALHVCNQALIYCMSLFVFLKY